MEEKKIEITAETLKEDSSVYILTVSGLIDSYTARAFQKPIIELARSDASVVVMDCKDLTYVSSAGIGSFVVLGDELGKKGGLVLYNLQPNVLKIFTMLNMASFFNISKTKQEALNKAKSLLNKQL
ncbi:STAS domain-containing protein [Planctomycetota bacterium]